jgi:inosine/xanthosine triphosphatase
MRVAVGSTNGVKVKAVAAVIHRLDASAEVLGMEVDSGVSDQPLGDAETIEGAVRRARAARQMANADLGVGLEGGVSERPEGTFTNAWAAVVQRDGSVSIAGGPNMPLPPRVAQRIREGWELGTAMDELTGMQDTKKKMGAVGILTRGLLDRQRAYEFIVTLALVKFLNPDLYAETG